MENHNISRWFGFFIPSIGKVQRERVGQLSLSSEAVQYLDKLLIRLLVSLLTPVPKTLQDAQDQIIRKFPESLSSDALEDHRKKMRDKGRKKIYISNDKVQHIIKDISSSNPDKHVSQFFAAILEYMLSDVLKLTANYVQNIYRTEINEQDVKIAMFADKVLVNIFQGDDAEEDVPLLPITSIDDSADVSYDTLVKNLITEEQRYLKDIQLIIKFFKKFFLDRPYLFSEEDIELIFNNIEDIAEMSAKLIVLLEEAKEMTDDNNPIPLVGNCFAELAEECSFELYSEYAINYTKEGWNDHFQAILEQTAVNTALKNVKTEGFRDMVTYVLPNLLLAPIYHGLYYIEQIQMLERTSTDVEDRESFTQTVSATSQIKVFIESKVTNLPKNRQSEMSLRISWKGGVQVEKMKEIEASIESWVGKTIQQSCNEFIYEGDLKRFNGKKTTERRVFLFDSLLVCCKANQGRRPMPTVTTTHEYRFKEKILLRKTIVVDDEKNPLQFVVMETDNKENKWTFVAHGMEEKRSWMAHLVRLQHRSTYDRMLDQLLRKEVEEQPLRLPEADVYRFAEPDSDENLIMDHEKSTPIIKGGTVRKLVERLTYHKYCDSGFTKTFLTTFRSFCKPSYLLQLLIERFHIPEPLPTEEQQAAIDRGEIITRDDLKRFRNEYAQPIQLRVLNVLRQWLEFHWYDFEADRHMLERVEAFVTSIRGKSRQKFVRTIERLITKKKNKLNEEDAPTFTFDHEPPPVEWHSTHDKEKFSIFTLHPIEIARQLTLLEFDLYRKVHPSELVGTVWTKSGKEENAPNLLKMIHCSTTVTRWLCRSIIEMMNLEERTSVMARAVEIMQVLKQLNNFNGMLEFVSAFNSSAIHRLNHTKQHLPDRLTKIHKDCMDLCDPRLTKCLEKLRSCDPPCVPFVGTFLTNIFKTEEGNPHLLPNYPEKLELINFAKRRMVASIVFDLQQYQNQRYNLTVVPEIRDFFVNLKPMKGYDTEKQFNDYIYKCSLEVEPRQSERATRFPRTLTDKEIKSPGIIPSKKSSKNLYRDESRITLSDRRCSLPEEDTISTTVGTPDAPATPVKKDPTPPPCPPRYPLVFDQFSSLTTADNNVFSFDFPNSSQPSSNFISAEEDDIPPPLPPRDDIPFVPSYAEPEQEFFHNEDIILQQRHQYGEQSGFFQAQLNGFNMRDYHQPDVPYLPEFHEDRAPPVPPRDPFPEEHNFYRDPMGDAPAIPPRDPVPISFDNLTELRYACDQPRPNSSHFYPPVADRPTPPHFSHSAFDTPPPVPRRQPSAHNF